MVENYAQLRSVITLVAKVLPDQGRCALLFLLCPLLRNEMVSCACRRDPDPSRGTCITIRTHSLSRQFSNFIMFNASHSSPRTSKRVLALSIPLALKHLRRANIQTTPLPPLENTVQESHRPVHMIQPPPRNWVPSFIGAIFPGEEKREECSIVSKKI